MKNTVCYQQIVSMMRSRLLYEVHMLNVILKKIDLFMRTYILPQFNPEHLHWVFSLSGGKDSYTMCQGIFEWYKNNHYLFKASGIYIWQWGDNPREYICSTLPWLESLYIKDARKYTSMLLDGHSHPVQSQCRSCSDIRHHISDMLLEELASNEPVFLCRGLHLTDMTISILWRLVWYGTNIDLCGKGMPITRLLNKNCFLVKPLCFVREYECQQFELQQNYKPFFCDCPSRYFPARRDIIEESVRLFYSGDLWEFDVPGCKTYLRNTLKISDTSLLRLLSLPGKENKKNCIPDGYYSFAKDYFLHQPKLYTSYEYASLLENQIENLLIKGVNGEIKNDQWTCRLFINTNSLTDFDLRMIGTLGPFWAAIALPSWQRKKVFSKQSEYWNFKIDKDWSQVCDLLYLYYHG